MTSTSSRSSDEAVEGRAGGVLRADLFAEQVEGFLTRPADLLMHPRRPGLHLLVHPVTAALAVHDTNAFANRVKDEIGLLRNQRALQRQKIR